jgi:hypothetical protein
MIKLKKNLIINYEKKKHINRWNWKKNVKKTFITKKYIQFKTFHFKVNLKGKKERKMVRLFNLKMHKLKEGFGELA